MPGFSSLLSSSEIDSIIRYVQGLGAPGATTTTTITVPPDDESGASIYGRLCAACHGGDGSGGSGGPITGTEFHGSALSSVITDGLGTMPGFGTQLNDGQVARLVDYVERLAAGTVAGVDVTSTLPGAGAADPEAGFTGHASEIDGSAPGEAEAVALGLESSSPLPVGNPMGWTLAFAIAAFLIALGSAVTGALPKEAEERAAG